MKEVETAGIGGGGGEGVVEPAGAPWEEEPGS